MCDGNAVGCADEDFVDMCVMLLLWKGAAGAWGIVAFAVCGRCTDTLSHTALHVYTVCSVWGLQNLSWYILVPRPFWCAVLARGSRDAIRAQGQWFGRARPWRCAPLVVASPARSQFASCCS